MIFVNFERNDTAVTYCYPIIKFNIYIYYILINLFQQKLITNNHDIDKPLKKLELE